MLNTVGKLPRWLSGKESASNVGEEGSIPGSLSREDPLEEEMATHSGSLSQEDSLEKEMATHSSILA